MNQLRTICCIILFTGLADSHSIGCAQDEVVEIFFYPDELNAETSNQQTEYLIISRKVSWMDANTLCPSYGSKQAPSQVARSSQKVDGTTDGEDAAAEGSEKSNTSLAIFSSDKERNWLARMLSESNYRYEGLWIGGTRKNKSTGWHWNGDRKLENNLLSSSLIYENYPSWYKVDEEVTAEQNCLLFNKIGHDVPVFIPENCQLPRPFVCIRIGQKRPETTISEAGSVSIDGYRYTLFRVTSDGDMECQDSGMSKLNGGGVTWKRAQFECKKRGQQLAMVLTNEAAMALADLMMKNRPSMENAWMGGRSVDGMQWTWVTSGSILSTTKSESSQYPPWLEGHPILVHKSHKSYTKLERCLILDRHLCPEQIAPVFLDLDCDKERPFICQDGFDERQTQKKRKSSRRTLADNNEMFDFSENKMTFAEGEDYCGSRKSQIANVLNPKMLSAVLDKMSELSIDHVWIGGRTEQIGTEWQWVDLAGQPLSAKEVGANAGWCFGDNSDFLPKAEPNVCLNLDYEARGFPLLYGLPCSASQIVLCGGETQTTAIEIAPALPEDVDTRLSLNGTMKGDVIRKNKTMRSMPKNAVNVKSPSNETIKADSTSKNKTMEANPEDVNVRLSFNDTIKEKATSKNKTFEAMPEDINVRLPLNSTIEKNTSKNKTFEVMSEDINVRLPLNDTIKQDSTNKNTTFEAMPEDINVRLPLNDTIKEDSTNKNTTFEAMPEDINVRLSFNDTIKEDSTNKNKIFEAMPEDINVRLPLDEPTEKNTTNKNKTFEAMPEDINIRLPLNETMEKNTTSKNKTFEAMPEDVNVRLPLNGTMEEKVTRKNEILDTASTTSKVDEVKMKDEMNISGTQIPVPQTVQTPVTEVNGIKAKGFQENSTAFQVSL